VEQLFILIFHLMQSHRHFSDILRCVAVCNYYEGS